MPLEAFAEARFSDKSVQLPLEFFIEAREFRKCEEKLEIAPALRLLRRAPRPEANQT